jgi:hypothetical protein
VFSCSALNCLLRKSSPYTIVRQAYEFGHSEASLTSPQVKSFMLSHNSMHCCHLLVHLFALRHEGWNLATYPSIQHRPWRSRDIQYLWLLTKCLHKAFNTKKPTPFKKEFMPSITNRDLFSTYIKKLPQI